MVCTVTSIMFSLSRIKIFFYKICYTVHVLSQPLYSTFISELRYFFMDLTQSWKGVTERSFTVLEVMIYLKTEFLFTVFWWGEMLFQQKSIIFHYLFICMFNIFYIIIIGNISKVMELNVHWIKLFMHSKNISILRLESNYRFDVRI